MRIQSEVEVQKVAVAEVIANKQLEYFKLQDKKITSTHRGLVQAVTKLSLILGRTVSTQQEASSRRHLSTPYNFNSGLNDKDKNYPGVEGPHVRFSNLLHTHM